MSYKLDKDSLDWSQPIIDKVRPTNILAKANPRIDALLSLPRSVKKAVLMSYKHSLDLSDTKAIFTKLHSRAQQHDILSLK